MTTGISTPCWAGRHTITWKPARDSFAGSSRTKVQSRTHISNNTPPPDFVGRNKRTQTSTRFRTNNPDHTREYCWKNNHPVLQQQEWNSVEDNFRPIAPPTETKQIKNIILTSFCTNKIKTASSTWRDKIEFFTTAFEDIVPAANAQTTLAIVDLDDYNTNVFTFTGLEPLNGNFQTLNIVANPDYSNQTRTHTRYFHFTLTIDPRLVNTRNLNLDTLLFPSQATTTIYIRALQQNNSLHPDITKNIIENTPKLLILPPPQCRRTRISHRTEDLVRRRPQSRPTNKMDARNPSKNQIRGSQTTYPNPLCW
jgi:hypothetical protein